MSIRIYPYNMGSKSSKLLSAQLMSRRVYSARKYSYNKGHVILNWGNSEEPSWATEHTKWINRPVNVGVAANKLHSFNAMSQFGVNIPSFCTTKKDAKKILDAGHWVVCRTKLTGHSGEGIVIATKPEELVDARLYVRYIKKTTEYRIHIFNGVPIDATEKKRKRDAANVNYQIRSHDNGWVHCRENVVVPDEAFIQAIKAVEAHRLTFGAVDIVHNQHYGTFVLEVNTAPGLAEDGTSLAAYLTAIKGLKYVV